MCGDVVLWRTREKRTRGEAGAMGAVRMSRVASAETDGWMDGRIEQVRGVRLSGGE